MKTVNLKTIEQNDNVNLYSICFNGNDLSEYENYLMTNPLFRECLAKVSDETRAEFNLSFEIAERIDSLLKKKGITQKELAVMMGKRESEISKWLTGRHNFTTKTLASISLALGEPIISVPA